MSELVACSAKAAYGAGPAFYLALVKVLSLFDKNKLQDKKSTESLLMGILKGLTSDEGSFYGQYALNASCEVLLFLIIKFNENNSFLYDFLLNPVGLYLNCSTPINANSYLAGIPSLFGQTLGFLETKEQFPDVFESLFAIISKTLSNKFDLSIEFLQEFSVQLGSQGPQCKNLVEKLLNAVHSLMTKELEQNFLSKNFSQLGKKLPLFKKFSEITLKYTNFEVKILE